MIMAKDRNNACERHLPVAEHATEEKIRNNYICEGPVRKKNIWKIKRN